MYSRRQHIRTAVSQSFRQLVLSKYPVLSDEPELLRFFQYICFSTFLDEATGQVVVPTKVIAEHIYRVPYSHFNGRRKLEELRDRVLPGLTWTEHDPFCQDSWIGKARQLSCTGLDEEMLRALDQECLAPTEPMVDLITGAPHTRERRYGETEAANADYERELSAATLNPTQRKIISYLRRINAGHLFLRRLRNNHEAIHHAIGQLEPHLQGHARRVLASAQQNPQLYYLPSPSARTCRLSPWGDTILSLKSEVRKAATKPWVECDLRSSQFAILAAKLNAPLAKAQIASGQSIWRAFHQYTHGIDADPPRPLKKVFKEAMYSLCFGKGQHELRRFCGDNGIGTLTRHPVFRELMALREKWFAEIDAAGGAADVWSVWQAIDNTIDPKTKKSKRWAGAVAATVIQSIEMEIIAPIFDVAVQHGERDRFKICLFQHDGATLSFQSAEKKQRAQAKLKKAVEDRARALGIDTILEFTDL